jgi:hypothetical protein
MIDLLEVMLTVAKALNDPATGKVTAISPRA